MWFEAWALPGLSSRMPRGARQASAAREYGLSLAAAIDLSWGHLLGYKRSAVANPILPHDQGRTTDDQGRSLLGGAARGRCRSSFIRGRSSVVGDETRDCGGHIAEYSFVARLNGELCQCLRRIMDELAHRRRWHVCSACFLPRSRLRRP